jgi:hypothetical protein
MVDGIDQREQRMAVPRLFLSQDRHDQPSGKLTLDRRFRQGIDPIHVAP